LRTEGDYHDEIKLDRNGNPFTMQVCAFAIGDDTPASPHAVASVQAALEIGERLQLDPDQRELQARHCGHEGSNRAVRRLTGR